MIRALLAVAAAAWSLSAVGAPTLIALEPSSGPTSGGANLTLQGSDFGASPAVLVNSRACSNVVVLNATQLTCVQPPGVGSAAVVAIVAGAQTSNLRTFSYFPPAITQVTNQGVGTTGDEVVFVYGTNFGESPTVTVGGKPCPVISGSHTNLSCNLPPGSGQAELVVRAGDQEARTTYRYAAPSIALVNPSSGPTAGGIPLTLRGSNFGDVPPQVTVGGTACPVSSAGHTQLVCTLPEGQGAEAEVRVRAGGLESARAVFDYQPPGVHAFAPSGGPTRGGVTLTLTGVNFGLQPSVTVGDAPCPVTVSGHQQLQCTLPPGQGQTAAIQVTVAGQPSAVVPYPYAPPRLDGLTPASAPRSGGTALTLHGANFGTSSEVSVGGKSCPISSQDHGLIVCTVPAGNSLSEVRVTVSGQISNPVQFAYDGPVVTMIEPSSGPTAGGVTLTLSGLNFGPDGATVFVGPSQCPILQQTDVRITCTVPPGIGSSVPVNVISAGATLSALPRFSYTGPALLSLEPSTGPRSGGTPLTIHGTNFSTGGLVSVNLDDTVCPLTLAEYDKLVCTTPARSSGSAVVQVQVLDQLSNALAYHYVDARPVAQAGTTETNEDSSVEIPLVATDSDGDPLVYQLIEQPPAGEGTVTLDGAVATFVPAHNFHGETTFRFAAEDGELVSVPAGVQVSVGAVNDAPTALPLTASVTAGARAQLTLQGTDVDGDGLSFTLGSLPPASEAVITLAGATATVTPAAGFQGTTAFSFTVSDGAVSSSAAIVSVAVGVAPGAPVVTDVTATTGEDVVVTFELPGQDTDEVGTLRFAVVQPPAPGTGSLSLEGRTATFTPARDFHGDAQFTFLATDGLYTSSTATATITVTAVNDAPVAESQAVATAVGQAIDITLSAVDTEAQPLTFEITRQPEEGELTLTGAQARFVPAADFSGEVSFAFTASDGEGSSQGTVTVAVLGTVPEAKGCAALPAGPSLLGLLALALLRRSARSGSDSRSGLGATGGGLRYERVKRRPSRISSSVSSR